MFHESVAIRGGATAAQLRVVAYILDWMLEVQCPASKARNPLAVDLSHASAEQYRRFEVLARSLRLAKASPNFAKIQHHLCEPHEALGLIHGIEVFAALKSAGIEIDFVPETE